MSVIASSAVLRAAATKIWFFIAVLVFGLLLSAEMPTVSLVGFRSIAPRIAELPSPVVGGVGISLALGGAGLLLAAILRSSIAIVSSKIQGRASQEEWVMSTICCGLGILLTAWYVWSYLRPM